MGKNAFKFNLQKYSTYGVHTVTLLYTCMDMLAPPRFCTKHTTKIGSTICAFKDMWLVVASIQYVCMRVYKQRTIKKVQRPYHVV